MAYTNSPMVAYTKLSPNHSGQRTHSIDRITPHCVVGQCTAEGLGEWFEKTSTKASSNYGIDKDGRVGMYVEEKNRSWCSSSSANDQRAITIECASDTTEPYAFRDIVYQTLIKLCVDICQRNGKDKLLWFGDKDKTLNYEPKSGEMILTVHRWFANKSCPGNWMYARMGDLLENPISFYITHIFLITVFRFTDLCCNGISRVRCVKSLMAWGFDLTGRPVGISSESLQAAFFVP